MAVKGSQTTAAQQPQLTENDLKRHLQELGVLGRLFGSKEHAPIYFAGILAIMSLFGACIVGLFAPDTPGRNDLIKTLVGIVVAALSFIGGASGRSSN